MKLTDLRKLQILEVNLLSKFQEICENHKLTYYFVGGGLIGALRHGGFIPWDDDLDIVMPRDDYEKFMDICKDGVDGGYGVAHYKKGFDKDWNTPFSRFVDLESEINCPTNFSMTKMNVWIDLFAIDGTPDNPILRWLHFKYILFLRYLLVLSDINKRAGYKKRPFYERAILYFFKIIPLFQCLNTKHIAAIMEKSMKQYKINESKYCCNYMGLYREKEIQPKERWGTPATLNFEGIKVKVPELYHEFQTHIYGNYMQLPPVEKRVSHNVSLVQCRNIDFEAFENISK